MNILKKSTIFRNLFVLAMSDSDPDSFVMVDPVPDPVPEVTYAEQLALRWESWCYSENLHLGLGAEAVFIAGALALHGAAAATRMVKTVLSS